MKGDVGMSEEKTAAVASERTLQSSDNSDNNEEQNIPAEAVPYRKKKGSLADTAAMQAILCLITAVGFVAANIAKPDLAADIFAVYLDKNSSSDGFTDIIRAVADFLRSTPNV